MARSTVKDRLAVAGGIAVSLWMIFSLILGFILKVDLTWGRQISRNYGYGNADQMFSELVLLSLICTIPATLVVWAIIEMGFAIFRRRAH